MRYPFLAGAAVVVLTAALAACGSSSDGDQPEAGSAKPSATGAPVAGPAAGPDAPAGPSSTTTSEPPKLPTDQLTPATGSFTKKQKEYLVNRVPKGMDPAAVLQTGQETCDKLSYLVKVDKDTAVAGIVTGEVTGAEPAVAHLCTEHRDLVARAALGYADGTHKSPRPGRYYAVTPTKSCTWQITGAGGKSLASGTSDSGKRVAITVAQTARAFTSTGCYAWLPEGDNG
ncbi:hypothetical protein [Streptomyces sp. NBC_00316]|uniref:hypothetical protein n=1 Tax=Streptomyces sp. NBC_00316 TaxID=2975710 RepID=UPI002E29E7C2|nr:hypothetical protein [Streptomyces sp. NBC_00316]